LEAFERTSCIDIDMEKVVSLQREGDMRVLRAVLTSNRLPALIKPHWALGFLIQSPSLKEKK